MPFSFRVSFASKSKNPARLNLRGAVIPKILTFAVLEAFACPGLAVFFAFLFAGIAGQQALGLERRAQGDVRLEQRARNAVTDRSGLAGRTAAHDVDADVILA